jgi:flavin reductase (DIM6/NTAB) family NADH-FMN oxidoreductase RutF
MAVYNPLQTIIVTGRSKGFDNATTLSWHTPISMQPFLYGILLREGRKMYEMITESRVFCVNFIPAEMEKTVMLCGTKSGHKTDKFREGSIPKEECGKIDCPRIKGCSAYLECKLVDSVKEGDHYILVGEVVDEVKGSMKKRIFQNNIEGPFTFTTTKD